jgi:16S rRNA (guanine1207-N2)-methyltransferase
LPRAGFEVRPELGDEDGFGAALVQIVKSKARTLSALAEALGAVVPGGLILIDGAKEEGIEAVLKALKPHVEIDGVFSKAHGKLIWFRRPDAFPEAVADWIALPTETEDGYVTAPGGFSADAPDRGSEILVALVPPLKGRVADLGAGWGYLSGEILAEQAEITHLDLIEADHDMLEAARVNIDDPRAAFHWADATRFEPEDPYDAISRTRPSTPGAAPIRASGGPSSRRRPAC